MRQVILDTETTGLNCRQHCIVEIGAVEMIDRQLTGQQFHTYLKPRSDFDAEAQKITGLTPAMLVDKPPFSEVAHDLLAFIKDAELLIHNAPFDLGFLNAELDRLPTHYGQISDYARVLDTLVMAQMHYPGQRNSLDALCKRLGISLAQRSLHGALLDAQLLARVYIAMTSGQDELDLDSSAQRERADSAAMGVMFADSEDQQRPQVRPTAAEQAAHTVLISRLREKSGRALWDAIQRD